MMDRRRILAGVLFVTSALLVTLLIAGTAAHGQATEQGQGRGVIAPSRQMYPDARIRGLHDVAAALNARERALERREHSVEARERDLLQAEERLRRRLEELDTLRGRVSELLKDLNEDQETKVIGLVKMVENMRPKDGAQIMTEVDADLAVEVLDRMNRSKAGKLLAEMQPAKAADLAEKMTEPPDVGGP